MLNRIWEKISEMRDPIYFAIASATGIYNSLLYLLDTSRETDEFKLCAINKK